MKIAFCFLTNKNINNVNLWKQFFINNNNYNIYIHNKEHFDNYFTKYIIPSKIDTKWGDISLVKATLLLFEEAFKDNENEYFILLSESCIPLHNFDYIYNKINLNNSSIINTFNENKQHQWVLLKRDLLEWFLNNKYLEEFNDFKPPDEYYFINLIKKFNLQEKFKINDIPLTFVNWKDLSDNPKYRILPKTYDSLNNTEYNYIVSKKYLFARKFSDICNFNYQLLKNININLSLIIKNWINDTVYWLQLEDKKCQILSLCGTYTYFLKNNIKPIIISYDEINNLSKSSKIIISGNYNNLNFNKKILKIQDKHNILILPHSNLNKFLIKKFNKNIIALAKDEKTYQYYQDNNINSFLTIDTAFYLDINDFNLVKEETYKHTEILYNDENIYNYDYQNIKEEVKSILNLILRYKYIKTNQIDIIIGCILLNTFCEINDIKQSLNKFYFDYFLSKVKNLKFVTI